MRQRLKDESGIALVMAVGILAVLMVAGATVVFYASSNARSSEYSADDTRALNLAEAGENYARAVLWNASDPTSPTSFSGGPLSLEGGTVTYFGSYDAATKLWTLTGTGTYTNPTGGASPLSRTVSSKVLVTTTSGLDPAWGYLFADTTSCTILENNLTIDAPIYVRGDLCMRNSAVVTGDIVQVRGRVQIMNTASIGTASVPVPQVKVGNGCRYPWSGSYVTPCGSPQRVYRSIFSNVVPDLTKPPIELDRWYADSRPGPTSQICTNPGGVFPGTFDTDTTLNRLNPTVNLLPTVAYNCEVRDGTGALLGRIAYTPGSPGAFRIDGVVFFDGNVEINANRDVVYTGRGTIYASGSITIRNFVTFCAVAGCGGSGSWDPEVNLLTLVAGKPTGTGFAIENNSTYQGAIYVVSDFVQENSVIVCGPIIADELIIENNTDNCYVPFGTPTPGMPGSSTPSVTLLNVPDSFNTD
jgi:hypothetical protein